MLSFDQNRNGRHIPSIKRSNDSKLKVTTTKQTLKKINEVKEKTTRIRNLSCFDM